MRATKTSNYRVEVYPRTRVYGIKVVDEKDICDEILEEVKRHVDNVEIAVIVSDKNAVCEHCGRQWTEDGDTYNGGCCKADQDAEEARILKVLCCGVTHDVIQWTDAGPLQYGAECSICGRRVAGENAAAVVDAFGKKEVQV